MPGERTIAASPARLRRGWRAGLRAQSRWLDTAAGLLAVGFVLSAIPWHAMSGIGARWQAAVADPTTSGNLLGEVVTAASMLAVALAAAFGLARLLSALLAGRVGPVDRSGLARLGAAPARPAAMVWVALSVLAVVSAVVLTRDVVAAGARAVDASPAATVMLWTTWPQRAWAVCLALLAVVGWAELMLARRQTRHRLAQSPQQLRDDRLAQAGGRR